MNGYTTITIGGKTVGLKFGMYSFRVITDKFDKIKAFEGESINELGIAVVLHAGYLNNCVVKDIEPELTFENFVDCAEAAALDGNGTEIQDAVKAWTDSQFMKKAVETISDAKKKLTGTKLKKGRSAK